MDEDFSLDILYIDEYVTKELYELVRQDLCSQLHIRLRELTNSIEYLTTLTWQGEEQLSLLMVAALNGYDDIIRVLLTHCNSKYQVELRGQVFLSDNNRIDGVTALYCACYRGHFIVAKTLIELGQASPNQYTYDYPHCPLLIYAARINRLDIVRFLLENGYSDVNETKSDDCNEYTALIWAAFRGHTSLVEYLIDYGADVNYSCEGVSLTARTPLLCAVLAGHVESVRLLYVAGADIHIKNDRGDIPLIIAVKRKHYSIIKFLLERFINTVEELELAACSLIKFSSRPEQIHKVLELLKIALQRRKLINIPKVCIEPIATYDYKQECQTIEELDAIKDDPHRICLETLLIRERIFLLCKDIAIMKPLHNYGDMLVEREEFVKCFDVWIHMFDLYQQMKMDTVLHRFVWLFCKMFMANRLIPVHRFLRTCELVFEPSQTEERDYVLNNTLFLVIIATKILKQEGITKEEKVAIYHWIEHLCRLQLTTENGQTLLHLCVDVNTNNNLNFHQMDTSRYLKFPNESGLRLLLACGSRWIDLDAIEFSNRNTPLHLICQGTKDRQIIELLLNSGCHMDCINNYGKVPIDYVENEEIRSLIVPTRKPLNLKCLCARIIANKRLNTREFFGGSKSALNKFIILHGGG